MYSPRSSQKIKLSDQPISYGQAIPSDPKELLKLLLLQSKTYSNSIASSQGRFALQSVDDNREKMESKLMEFEDYTYTDDGRLRALRYEDRIKMESEDIISAQHMATFKDQNKIDFREQIRREVEQRKLQEQLEKEERKKKAEERRLAVVERIRKQKEDEERRAREAELELLRIEEEKIRRQQEILNRLEQERRTMTIEDEVSRYIENEYREELMRSEWKQQEERKMLEWEARQRELDEKERCDRERRLVDLEAKKAKLKEIKQLQQLTSGNSCNSDADKAAAAQAVRDEAAKIAKQMRIQNKAKFVSKRIKAGDSLQQVVADTAPPEAVLPLTEGDLNGLVGSTSILSPTRSMRSSHGASFFGSSSANILGTQSIPGHVADDCFGMSFRLVAEPVEVVEVEEPLSAEFLQSIAACETEAELRVMLKALMMEKRSLRLEQKQRPVEAGASTVEAEEAKQRAKAMRVRLRDLSRRDDAIQRRLDELMKKKNAPVGSSQEDLPVVGQSTSTALVDTRSRTEEDKAIEEARTYQRAESLLREAGQLLRSQVVVDKRAALSLSVEMADVAKGLSSDRDPASYRERLVSTGAQLKDLATRVESAAPVPDSSPAPVPVPSRSPRLPHSPPPTTTVTGAPLFASPMLSMKSRPEAEDERAPTPDVMEPLPTLQYKPPITPVPSLNIASLLISTVDDVSSPASVTELMTPRREDKAASRAGDSLKECESKDTGSEDGVAGDSMLADIESVPGWNECLYTTMATAAHHAAFYGFTQVLELLARLFDCFVVSYN